MREPEPCEPRLWSTVDEIDPVVTETRYLESSRLSDRVRSRVPLPSLTLSALIRDRVVTKEFGDKPV